MPDRQPDREIERLFKEEVRDKKIAATGARGRKGKRGLVGKVVTPADVSHAPYSPPGETQSFNVYELIQRLEEAPTLKTVLLERMDEEYHNYRRATERTLNSVIELLKLGVEPLEQEVQSLRAEVDDMHRAIDALKPETAQRSMRHRRRIRWGSSPDSIRDTVFDQLRYLRTQGYEINTETIKNHIPSMLRWIYGDKAIFSGIEGLRHAFDQVNGTENARADGVPSAVI